MSLENQGTVKLNVCPFAEVSEKHLSFTRISFTKNPTKIPDMLDLDLSRLLNLATAYNRQNKYGHMIKDVESPSISDFEVIAETDEEVKEYETAKAFIDACKDLENKFNIKMFAGTIAQSTKGVIGADQAQGLGANALRFNHVRILNKRRHKKRQEALSL
mgnify:CR=1 FL=1